MNKDDKQDVYYVGIDDPVGVRRAVLETAKDVVKTISMHNHVRDIQDEKLRLRTQLAGVIHTLKEDLKKLEAKLPQRDVKAMPAVVHEVPKARQVVSKHADHRLDKIEAALNEIEERMKHL